MFRSSFQPRWLRQNSGHDGSAWSGLRWLWLPAPISRNGRSSPRVATSPYSPADRLYIMLPSRSTPASIRSSTSMVSAAVKPPAEWPNMPTEDRFSARPSPAGRARRWASGLPPPASTVSWSSTNRVSATRVAIMVRSTSGLLGGSAPSSTRPPGNSTALASCGWSTVTTT